MNYSVIIPTYNRQSLLGRALNSVFSQTVSPTEVIVVDDGSTDQTAAFVTENFPQVNLIQQDNRGVSAARNVGFQLTNSDWIALLDSDDEWLPSKMEKQFAELKRTGLSICHTEEIWVRNGVRVNAKNKHQKKGGDIFFDCLNLCAMSPSSIVLHRKIWQEVDGFDEEFVVCEDYDLWLRICAKYEVALVERASIIKYGGHEDQLSRQYFGMDKFRIMSMQKILETKLALNKKDKVVEVLVKKLQILLTGAKKHNNQEMIDFCQQRQNFLAENLQNYSK